MADRAPRLGRWQALARDREFLALVGVLAGAFLLLHFFGHVIAPVLVALAIAYVLDGMVEALVRLRFARWLAAWCALVLALAAALLAVLAVLPLLLDQIARFVREAPQHLATLRAQLAAWQQAHAEWINPRLVENALASLFDVARDWGGKLVSFSVSSIPDLVALAIYAILVPVLVFFLLKDKPKLLAWMRQWLPAERRLFLRVWNEVDAQIGNYIRGKVWETLIVGTVAWAAFAFLHHPYALLLGALTGISVWVPFIGAAVTTLPVILLSFFSWGASEQTLSAIVAYLIVQALDGNVLVPWLFSEMVDLHPVAIVIAVLVFGALWGVVGVFVAIPMAALIESVLAIALERQGAVEAEKHAP